MKRDIEGLSVAGPARIPRFARRTGNAAIKLSGQVPGRAAGCGHHHEAGEGILRRLGRRVDVRDRGSVGRPGRADIGSRVGGELGYVQRLDVDDPDIGIAIGVRLFRAVRDEGDATPVGRPGNVVLVERSRGQDLGLAAAQPRRRQRVAQIDQIYMLFAIVEPLGSPLVTEPGDDNYGRSVGGTELRFGLGITRDNRQPAAVGSPTVARYSSSKGGHRKGRAAAQREQEDLAPARGASGHAPRIRIPVGHKSEISAVGRELGHPIVILTPYHFLGRAARYRNAPDARYAPVFLAIDFLDGVDGPSTVGGSRGVLDGLDGIEVFQRHRTPRGSDKRRGRGMDQHNGAAQQQPQPRTQPLVEARRCIHENLHEET